MLDLFRDLVGDPAASEGSLDKRLTIARRIDPAEAAGSSVGRALLRVVAQHQADRKFKAPFPIPLAPSNPAQRPDKLT